MRAHAATFWNPERRLLLDPAVVERAEGARLVLGSVEKDSHNPLFGEDKPWEIKFDNLYANVMFDEAESLYKCWYNPFIRYSQYEATPRAERQILVLATEVPMLPTGFDLQERVLVPESTNSFIFRFSKPSVPRGTLES